MEKVKEEIKIDMEEVALLEISIKEYKARLEEIKNQIRAGAKTINNDYCTFTTATQNTYSYTEEDQEKIDNFIKDNHIEKVLKDSKPNYKITFKPTLTAQRKFNRMQKSAIDNAQNNAVRSAACKLANVK